MNTKQREIKAAKRRAFWKQCGIFLFAAGVAGPTWPDIHVGQVAPMNNPIAVEGKETNIGISVAIDSANAKGGIGGQKIVLRTEDDGFNADKTVALVRELAKSDTIALMMAVGSPGMGKLLQEHVLESTGMPMVGVLPGAESLRKPFNPYVFHVRAGDVEQYRQLVRNALTIGLNKIAVIYLDTPPVKSGVAAMAAILKEASLEPVAQIAIAPETNADLADAMRVLKAANPNLIVMAVPGQLAGEILRAYRAQGMTAQITSLSYGTPDTICRIATPEHARGVSVAQVFPNIRNTSLPLVKRFQEDFHAYGPKGMKPTTTQFEGYVTAMVVLEGIRRIDGAPTREKLIKALNSMQKMNLGGFMVDFSAGKHVGSDYVELGVITKDCTVVY
jgi:ABC-type branched-subunit amino acid transport system substrate-binding protein